MPLAAAPPIEFLGYTFNLPEPITIFLREWLWWTFTNGFAVSFVLPGVLLFLILVLFNRFGSGLGLSSLFWRKNPTTQFLVGIGIGAVVWQVFLAGYLFEEFATNFTVDRPPFCEVRPESTDAGIVEGKYPGRFRTEPASIISIEWYAVAVASAGGVLALTIAFLVLVIQYVSRFVRYQLSGWKPYRHAKREPAVGYAIWLPLGAVAGWLAMTTVTATGLNAKMVTEPIGMELLDVAGWGEGAGRRAIIEARIKRVESRESDPRPRPEIREQAKETAREWFRPYAPVYGSFVLNFALIFVVSIALIAAPPHLRFFSPAVGIVLVLNILVFGHVILTAFPPLSVSGDFILLCLLTLIVLAGRAYKFRFPNLPANASPLNLQEKYELLADIEARVTAGTLSREAAIEELTAGQPGPSVRQVISDELNYPNAKAWSGPKPPLMIVCASGGGSRSAAWTMRVLLDLEQRFLEPGPARDGTVRPPVAMPYHIRLVSGASGGMIGASYYVATLAEPNGKAEVLRNTVTPATHTLVNRDLLALFAPIPQHYDRGHALEDAFRSAFNGQLHVPFAALRDGEVAGWRPSLIFAPMLVEDGRQLLISNLGLRSVTQNRAFILGESTVDAPTDQEGFALLSREGVEFFKLFPHAVEFTVATAARMSASFPYVLPAVSLPTNPPRRVVDAGYYDNYGVGVVASWLFNHMEWVEKHCSGVVIVQIRDGVSEKGRKREEVPDSFPPLIDRGLQWLTTPPAGLWSSRMASNAFRNDNLLHLLDDFFIAKGFPRGFFATVAFELTAGDDVALNFTLSDSEIAAIRGAVKKPAFTERADALINWWHARMESPHAPMSLPDVEDKSTSK
jgi:predicted acylesterase/phospholipase RssA